MAINLEKIRAARAALISNTKNQASGNRADVFGTELAKGSEYWWPTDDKAQQVTFRVLAFEVTQKQNCSGSPIGSFDAVRHVKVHYNYGPGGKPFVCPTNYGKPCPHCEAYMKYPKEERLKQDSTASKLKPKAFALFNALFKKAKEDGKAGYEVKVIKASYFASYEKLLVAVKRKAQFNKDQEDAINAFADWELGYFFDVGMAKESATNSTKEGGVKFMQMVEVDPQWKEKKAMLTEGIVNGITDLDKLIPMAPDYETLKAAIDDTSTTIAAPMDAHIEEHVEEGIVEEENADLGEGFGTLTDGAEVPFDAIPDDLEQKPEVAAAPAVEKKPKAVKAASVAPAPQATAEVATEGFGDFGKDFDAFGQQ